MACDMKRNDDIRIIGGDVRNANDNIIMAEVANRVSENEDQCTERSNILQSPSEDMSRSIAIIILEQIMRQWHSYACSKIQMDGQTTSPPQNLSHGSTTYSSNESPPREVNLMVSMHSSALFIVAIAG